MVMTLGSEPSGLGSIPSRTLYARVTQLVRVLVLLTGSRGFEPRREHFYTSNNI
jgi:hypothetical protein